MINFVDPREAERSDDILLVDDDPMVSEFMRRVLKGSGRRVRDFLDAESALDYLSSHTPRFLIVDTHMPLMSGPELFGRVLDFSHLKTTHMILCSAGRHLPDDIGIVDLSTVELLQKDDLLDRSTLLKRLGGPTA